MRPKQLTIALALLILLQTLPFFGTRAQAHPGLPVPGPTQLADFWVWDLRIMPPGFRKPQFERVTSATLLNGTDKVHIWVERELGADAPTPASIEDLMRLLVQSTPPQSIDPESGVLEIESRIFGKQPTPPSKDRDFNIVIAAMHNYESGTGKSWAFDGFFNGFDQLTEAEALAEGQHSNERNVVYINAKADLHSPYMQAVVAHELIHLITFAQREEGFSPWIGELLGEGGMQLTGFFTDTNHVNRYRLNPQWPLAVDFSQTTLGVSSAKSARVKKALASQPLVPRQGLELLEEQQSVLVSYGGVSMFSEYLLTHFEPAAFGRIAAMNGDSFTQIEQAYGQGWNTLFAGYADWLFTQKPGSRFPGPAVAVRAPASTLKVAPTGVIYLKGAPLLSQTELTSVPKGCGSSRNVVRTSLVSRATATAETEQATAVWVESTPPCSTPSGQDTFEKDAFVISVK